MGVTVEPFLPHHRGSAESALRACGRVFSEEEVRTALAMLDEALRGEYLVLSACIGPSFAGYCLAGPTPLTQSTWHLYWLCVHPRFQRQGVARALHDSLELLVANHGGERIVVETGGREDYCPASAFYLSAGYRECGRIPDYYRHGDACIFFCKMVGFRDRS